jgi:diadenosine tetraphosphate (Ap4A) HIT family hydrolase
MPEPHGIPEPLREKARPCPFCAPDPERVFLEGELVLALWDAFPVTDGHALIIPRRHVGSWFDATEEERGELLRAVHAVRKEIEATRSPDGYNVGMNLGAAAGQTIDHLHLHVIPRFAGDVEDPRGGIRWVIPERGTYWEDE